jgi:PAS domain S-box-containing protein
VIRAQAREISALKAELVAVREQVHRLVRDNPLPSWLYCHESLRFLDVNDAAVAAYGWSRDEFLEMTIVDIRPLEDVPALMDDVARMRGIPGGTTGPWRHRHKDGALVDVTVSFLSLPLPGNSARLIVAREATHALAAGAAPRPSVLGPSRLTRLSPREHQILGLVARGHTSERIAGQLGLSRKSVETYRARFAQKLGLRSRADIVQFALDHGVLIPWSGNP